MLGQDAFELGKAPRVLVLILHTGGAVGIFIGKGGHALGFDEGGDRFRFGSKRLPLRRLGAVTAAAHGERAGARRMAESEMQCGEAPHRQAGDMSTVYTEMIEHRENVIGGAILGIGGNRLRHIGGGIAAGVEGNDAVTPAEMPDLRLPAAIVAREFMDEDDRRPGPGLLAVQLHSVVGDSVWHRSLLQGYSLCVLCVVRLRKNVKYEDLYTKT